MATQTASSTVVGSATQKPKNNRPRLSWLRNGVVYALLTIVAFVMIFPFLVMVFTSFKVPTDTFSYPPRLLPREQLTTTMPDSEEPAALYNIEVDGVKRQMALVQDNIKIGVYADPNSPETTYERPVKVIKPTGGFMKQQTVMVNGKEEDLWDVEVDGQVRQMIQTGLTAYGRFVDPQDPSVETLANVRLSDPVTRPTWRPENYRDVLQLNGLGRSLTNTMLITMCVVLGQLITSVLGGYAFARLRFPGRDVVFVLYLGTMMIPFVVLIMPLYQLMVQIGWSDRLVALVMPWIFTAYGTFLMRQFFLTIPTRDRGSRIAGRRLAPRDPVAHLHSGVRAGSGHPGDLYFPLRLEQLLLAAGYHQHGQHGESCADAVAQRAARSRRRQPQPGAGRRRHLGHPANVDLYSGATLLYRERDKQWGEGVIWVSRSARVSATYGNDRHLGRSDCLRRDLIRTCPQRPARARKRAPQSRAALSPAHSTRSAHPAGWRW